MALIKDCGDSAPETFLRQNPGLHPCEMSVIYFIRIINSPSEKTKESYVRNLCRFSHYLNECGLDNFAFATPEHVSNYVSSLVREGLKSSTISTYMAAVKSFYSMMISLGMIKGDPASFFKTRLNAEVERLQKSSGGILSGHITKTLTESEIDYLLDITKKCAKIRDAVLVSFMYTTGVRASEVVTLCWGDIYDTGSTGWFAKITGKGGKEREVYLPPFLVEQLMLLRRNVFAIPLPLSSPGINIFPVFSKDSDKSKSIGYESIFKIVKKWGHEIAKTKMSPHWLRHTHATHLSRKGATLEQIQQNLGHSNITTTQKYVHRNNRVNPAGKLFD